MTTEPATPSPEADRAAFFPVDLFPPPGFRYYTPDRIAAVRAPLVVGEFGGLTPSDVLELVCDWLNMDAASAAAPSSSGEAQRVTIPTEIREEFSRVAQEPPLHFGWDAWSSKAAHWLAAVIDPTWHSADESCHTCHLATESTTPAASREAQDPPEVEMVQVPRAEWDAVRQARQALHEAAGFTYEPAAEHRFLVAFDTLAAASGSGETEG